MMFHQRVVGARTSNSCANSNGGHGLTTDEIEAAKILFSLSTIIESESRNVFSVQWASKKRRSAPSSEQSPPPSLLLQPSPENAKPSSPVTTLALWHSESDDKQNDSVQRKSKRKRRDELALKFENQSAIEELERRRTDIEQLRNLNLGLKAKIIHVTFGVRLPELKIWEEISHKNNNHSIHSDIRQQLQSTIQVEQTKTRFQPLTTEVLQHPINQVVDGLKKNQKHLSPLGIPDLNLCPEELGMDLVW